MRDAIVYYFKVKVVPTPLFDYVMYKFSARKRSSVLLSRAPKLVGITTDD